jgi:hypothetical protein
LRVTGTFGIDDPDIGSVVVERAIATATAFDAFQDNPWPLVYREMDSAFPGSKFVLTVRETNDWYESVARHFGGQSTAMRQWIYGVGDPIGNEGIYRDRYERHNREVGEYFAQRPEDLLVLRVTEGDGWEAICSFLGLPEPSEPFPHVNARGERRLDRRLRRRVGKALGGRRLPVPSSRATQESVKSS